MKLIEKGEPKKEEIEMLLGMDITEDLFNKALEYAKNKQAYIYKTTQRAVVLQDWYLEELTKEYVISLSLSRFTMDLCRELDNMEKEHLANCEALQTNNHIITVPAL